ncbi:hypothetical protein CGCF413_v012463 [Colletotrichum fructicola]|nr:hypothetical protein CGCF413_v012463 [Colletotrichum fructicola]
MLKLPSRAVSGKASQLACHHEHLSLTAPSTALCTPATSRVHAVDLLPTFGKTPTPETSVAGFPLMAYDAI